MSEKLMRTDSLQLLCNLAEQTFSMHRVFDRSAVQVVTSSDMG